MVSFLSKSCSCSNKEYFANKKGRSLRGKKSAFAVLRLFENSVPKQDEYHQGNSEYDNGLKFTHLGASAFFGRIF